MPDRTSQITALLSLQYSLVLILEDEREETDYGPGLSEELGDLLERVDGVTDRLVARWQRERSAD